METKNAIIKSAEIERGVPTSWVHLCFDGGAHQGFGGYLLGGEFMSIWVSEVLRVVGATKWEDLAGKPVRVRGTWDWIEALGNSLKDDWFDPAAVFAARKAKL